MLWDVADFLWDRIWRDRQDVSVDDAKDAQYAAPADQVRRRPLGIEPDEVNQARELSAQGRIPKISRHPGRARDLQRVLEFRDIAVLEFGAAAVLIIYMRQHVGSRHLRHPELRARYAGEK